MSFIEEWQRMDLRRRIALVFTSFILLTVPVVYLLYQHTASPLTYLDWWTSLFWASIFLVFLQEIYIYGRNFAHGKLSGTVTALFIAYTILTGLYDAYGFLVPDGEVSAVIGFAYTGALIMFGSTIGQKLFVFRKIDEWFYRVNVDEIRHVIREHNQ